MRISLLFVISLAVGSLLSACGGGGGGGGDGANALPPSANVSPGGVWMGVTSDGEAVVGEAVVALVTETGRFHFFTILGRQGAGVLSVTNENDVSGNFQFVTHLSEPSFPDGTTQSDCTLSGTVRERETMSVIGACTTTAGLQFQITVPFFTYLPTYERASSLATIAGMYQDSHAVINFAGDGAIFAQEAFTNCVMNGQVNIIDSAFNAYDVQLGYSNCTGPDANLNGATFVGIGYLLESIDPSDPTFPFMLSVPVIGEVNGVLVAWFIGGRRL